mgnify:CR=1 FL=1
MNELKELIRPAVRRLTPYSSARDEYQGEAEIWLDANELPFETGLNRYPDPWQRELKGVLSQMKGVDADRLFLGNGSDEAIDLLMRATCEPGRHKILQLPPTYGMYRVCADINELPVLEVPLRADFRLDLPALRQKLTEESDIRLLFLCSPNNPTGNVHRAEEVLELCRTFRGWVVVDEAYIDFSPEDSLLPYLAEAPNLVVLQTLSKAWGLAGIRLGMAWAHPELIAALNRIKPPYNISRLNQEAALKGLQERDRHREQVSVILQEREKLGKALAALPGVVEVFPSRANFLLLRFREPAAVFDRLREAGIVVRDRSRQVAGCLRITVGRPEENERLVDALRFTPT